ncbi:MAG: DUF4956 domain-containing protein [Oscillospiraceae bacterium]|nr:DUF4956 domain-containing protein [Oscillospiraceae bacterium]
MLDQLLGSIFSTASADISMGDMLLCSAASLVFGLIAAGIYMFRNSYTKNFVVTIALLPLMVQAVILLVNGNLGAGVAVAGTFGLVRFRSVPGNARDISSVFLSMAIGLATGMGYIGIAALFLLLIGVTNCLLYVTGFGEGRTGEKDLKVTIPENLDYTEIFDDIFKQYTKRCELVKVKTTNMGSLYELQYLVTLADAAKEKQFIDALRCRNGNLNISFGRISAVKEEL